MSSHNNKIITLNMQTVCSVTDLEELICQGLAREWRPQHPRDRTWHQLKYSGAKTYKGNWGSELITLSLYSQDCQCWCTQARAEVIRSWIRDSLFNEKSALDH